MASEDIAVYKKDRIKEKFDDYFPSRKKNCIKTCTNLDESIYISK